MTIDQACDTDLWAIRADDEKDLAIGKAQVGQMASAAEYLSKGRFYLSLYQGSRPTVVEEFEKEAARISEMAELVHLFRGTKAQLPYKEQFR